MPREHRLSDPRTMNDFSKPVVPTEHEGRGRAVHILLGAKLILELA